MGEVSETYMLWPDEHDDADAGRGAVKVTLTVEADHVPLMLTVFSDGLQSLSDMFNQDFVGVEVVSGDDTE